ncbi:L-threonylcarbamoyladenylate synthase [Alphaproteobacteria bacterium]
MGINVTSDVRVITDAVRRGDVVCVATDTLYALSCDALNTQALKKIYNIKKRISTKPTPFFAHSIEQARQYAIFNDLALKLAHAFWPGALTIVLPTLNTSIVPSLLPKNQSTIALRIPQASVVLKITEELDTLLVGTSANLSGGANVQNFQDFKYQLRNVDDFTIWFFEEKQKVSFIPSTIINIITVPTPQILILREGAISKQQMQKVAGKYAVLWSNER